MGRHQAEQVPDQQRLAQGGGKGVAARYGGVADAGIGRAGVEHGEGGKGFERRAAPPQQVAVAPVGTEHRTVNQAAFVVQAMLEGPALDLLDREDG